jgi:hypothetical protein
VTHGVLRPVGGAVALAALAVLALVPGGALAHEHRTIDSGQYSLIVGLDNEPPIQGQPKAATVRVSQASTEPAQPIEGAEQTLRLQVRQGRTTLALPLHAIVGKPGSYAADVVAGQAGDAVVTLGGFIAVSPILEPGARLGGGSGSGRCRDPRYGYARRRHGRHDALLESPH